MKALDKIKQLMAAGDTAQADGVLKELLAKPDNLRMKRLALFAGMLIWSNLLEADVAPDYVRHDSIAVDWYVPMILMVVALGIVSIYVLRWMRKREEAEKHPETDMKQKGE